MRAGGAHCLKIKPYRRSGGMTLLFLVIAVSYIHLLHV
jgi:hypothetical protein